MMIHDQGLREGGTHTPHGGGGLEKFTEVDAMERCFLTMSVARYELRRIQRLPHY